MKNEGKLLNKEYIYFFFLISFLPILIFVFSNFLKPDFIILRNLYYFFFIFFFNILIYFFFAKFYSIISSIKLIFFSNIFIFFSNYIEYFFYKYLLSINLIRPYYFYVIILALYVIIIKKIFFKKNNNTKNFVEILNKFLSIFFIFNIIFISINLLKKNIAYKDNIYLDLEKSNLTEIVNNNVFKKQNIYFIVLDGFQDFETFDNITKIYTEEINEFKNYLILNNFKIENSIRSSSIVTPISMGQTLSMNYLISEDIKYNLNLFFPIQDKWLKNDLPVINILKKRGYNINYYNSGLIPNKICNQEITVCLSRKTFFIEQDLIFLNNTPILRFLAKLFEMKFYLKILFPGLYEISDFVQDYKKMDIISNNGEFFYIHGIIPHAPYRFDRNCNYLDKLVINEVDRDYEEQYLCAIKQAKNLLNAIKSKDNNAIIILMSDHGSRLGGIEGPDYKIRELTNPEMIQLSSPLYAFSSVGCDIKKKILNTVNTFRAIFSCLDNKDYDFLDSKSILVGYPNWENPNDIFILK